MPAPYPEQVAAGYGVPESVEVYQGTPLALTNVIARDLPQAVPVTQAAAPRLVQEVTRVQSVPNGWVAPQTRERYVANPYFTAQGSSNLYRRTGIMPTIYQSDPYATAAYGVGPGGSVTALTGYPSRYPHVINLNNDPFNYARMYMTGLEPYTMAALNLLRQGQSAGGAPVRSSAATGGRAAPARQNPQVPPLAPSHPTAPPLAPSHTANEEWTWDGVRGESPAPATRAAAPALAPSHTSPELKMPWEYYPDPFNEGTTKTPLSEAVNSVLDAVAPPPSAVAVASGLAPGREAVQNLTDPSIYQALLSTPQGINLLTQLEGDSVLFQQFLTDPVTMMRAMGAW